MSPSSSAAPQSGEASTTRSHARESSTTTLPQQASTRPAKPSAAPEPAQEAKSVKKSNVQYTVFVRLPFQRGDFHDPPAVDWTAVKDRQLWKLISSASNSKDLDWAAMSSQFEVPLAFLLQQAAWLYEQHFEGMRAQMKRLGSVAPSPKPEAQQADPKIPPSINTQRLQSATDSGSSPATPRSGKPLLSRNPSTSTVTQSRMQGSPRQSSLRALRGSSGSQRRPLPPVQTIDSSQDGDDVGDESAVGQDGVSESDSEQPNARSRVTRRPPLGKKIVANPVAAESDGDVEDDDDEESSGDGYLPFAAAASSKPSGKDDPAATLRGSPKGHSATVNAANTGKMKQAKPPPPESSESSASSAQPQSSAASASSQQKTDRKRAQRDALSPRQRAQLAQLSPRYKSGSEGSPSMGSSFSDLDDLSVTQSALEEALMSNMQHGSIGMGSRMSSLRDALGRK